VIKHAGASCVRVATEVVDEATGAARVLLTVRDDGSAPGPRSTAGFGVGNMHARAQAAGGSLEIDSTRSGTELRLWLPIPQPGSSDVPV
jgi:signal transduction histidine kinase